MLPKTNKGRVKIIVISTEDTVKSWGDLISLSLET